jgi:hypothetical protein
MKTAMMVLVFFSYFLISFLVSVREMWVSDVDVVSVVVVWSAGVVVEPPGVFVVISVAGVKTQAPVVQVGSDVVEPVEVVPEATAPLATPKRSAKATAPEAINDKRRNMRSTSFKVFLAGLPKTT